ncbi:hypothetical protein [Methylobacterium brachiatum]|uniref:hypothetical protein n=1 Tax=Methylobacterium brachiatum TaxID=269660 RepID=UPI0013CEABF5|nr:hypothetical protein [Methylobacterium brachiatum]
MGTALLLLGAWFVVSCFFGPALILGGQGDAWIRRAGRIGTVIGAGMILCGGALL